MSLTRQRSDGRLEVADTRTADLTYGCPEDEWCILTAGHPGDCNEDREEWPGPDLEYPTPPLYIVEREYNPAMLGEHDPRL